MIIKKDIFHDLSDQETLRINFSGSLELSELEERVTQRVKRRLLTNPGELLAHSTYGVGIQQYIGKTEKEIKTLTSWIESQLYEEEAIVRTPPLTCQFFQVTQTSFLIKVSFYIVGKETINVIGFQVA